MKQPLLSHLTRLPNKRYRAGLLVGLLAIVLGVGLFAFAVPAHTAHAVSCNYSDGVRIKEASQTHGNETRHVYLWYSNSTACVWGVETNGQPGDHLYVWNKNTGALKGTYLSGHSGSTGEIGDNGSKSHACVTPLYSDGSYGKKFCTGYY